jgi:Domain of unknown function (DUF4386)
MPDDSPRPAPRVIGAVWLLYFLTGILGNLLTQDGPMSPNLALAVARIVDHQSTYRAGIAITLLANGLYIVLSALLYGLFAPVNRSLALAAAFLSLTGCIVQIVAAMMQLAAIVFHTDSTLAAAFSAEQIREAMLISLKVYRQNSFVSLPMFGLFNLLLGYLIYRSRYIPRVFGVFFFLAGTAWACSLWPGMALGALYVALPAAGLAELGTALWLLIKGIDLEKWRAASAGALSTLPN